ncbi:MAG TPA: hypothetical protein ENK37_07130 [Oceanithermus profundus]|uniref:Uncharacterized protein n=1 Tax=Oceanithermus profundus TaxID=187137 RepID=A0A7C4VCP3_9DEIN|nr:hypothetical protein [Oceanithermus profundus]
MIGLLLATLLTLAPLPGLPALPDGTEVRLVSPDLRTVYLYWRVERSVLRLKARPIRPPERAALRLLIKTGRSLHMYEARVRGDQIFVLLDDGYVNLRETFGRVYHLRTDKAFERWLERRDRAPRNPAPPRRP